MDKTKYTLTNYSFDDEDSYEEAKHELESVKYIEANTDFKDGRKVLKLYNSLLGSGEFKTVVGYDFLVTLRKTIIQKGLAEDAGLPKVKISGKVLPKTAKEYVISKQESREARYNKLIMDYRSSYRSSRIINIALAIIIIIMIGISIKSDRTVFKEFEESVIDKYAQWEEELNAREKEIQIREESLSGN